MSAACVCACVCAGRSTLVKNKLPREADGMGFSQATWIPPMRQQWGEIMAPNNLPCDLYSIKVMILCQEDVGGASTCVSFLPNPPAWWDHVSRAAATHGCPSHTAVMASEHTLIFLLCHRISSGHCAWNTYPQPQSSACTFPTVNNESMTRANRCLSRVSVTRFARQWLPRGMTQ